MALDYYLTLKRGLKLVAEWEAEHGALTAGEIDDADRLLGAAGVGHSPHRA
jgi:hypothetical protein